MHKLFKSLIALFLLTVVPSWTPALATGIPVQLPPSADASLLTGDIRLACEAILCLAASKPPHECDPALSRFFSIKHKKLSDTLDARRDFLNQCPDANSTSEMSTLVKAMAQGAGRCDAKMLNKTLAQFTGPGGDAGYNATIISNSKPTYCAAYIEHEYVRIDDEQPQYVGKPHEDGFWVEAKDYAAALSRYEREQAAKRAARQNYGSEGN